jgi:hypothetical protein
MNSIAKYNNVTGEILSVISVPQTEWYLYEPYVECDISIDTDLYYVENSKIVSRPAPPSAYHIFDYESKTWIGTSSNINFAKDDKKKQITDKANLIHISPIQYDGKLLDADETAQANISGKITELKNDIELNQQSNNLFWKDANNIVHTWTNASDYLIWLQGLFNMISTRRTNLYQISWQAKAQIDLETDIDNISNYDVGSIFQNV